MPKAKIPGYGLSVGWWGRNIHSHVVQAEQIPWKILALNRDKLFTIGLPFWAYQSVEPLPLDHDPRIIQCSCWKDTSQQADVACYSCYGERYIPGYLKFGFNTMWWSSLDNWTLTNVILNNTITPFRFQLAPNQVTGTLVSPPLTVTGPPPTGPWEARAEFALLNPPGLSSVKVHFSVNGGMLHDIKSISIVNPTPGSVIQWTVTMTRAQPTTPSPLFEIVRARYPTVPAIRAFRPDIPATGVVMVLRTWEMERFSREADGSRLETQGQRFWTLPLNFFDPSIEPDSADAKFGPRYFVKKASGPEAGICYVPTPPFSYSEQTYNFTRQEFNLRRAVGDPATIGSFLTTDGEIFYHVF